MRAALKQGECRKVLGAAQWLPRPASDLSQTYELFAILQDFYQLEAV